MARPFAAIPLLLAVCCSGALLADTVYKSVDKDGNVTYSQKPPRDGEKARTKELPIDPNQNVVPSDKSAETQALEAQHKARAGSSQGEAAAENQGRREKIAQAEAALQQAEAALAAGQSTQPGDFMGRAGGGVRPTQQREERINSLQEAVDAARANLERAKYDRDSY